MVFDFRGFRLDMVETIVAYAPPDMFAARYEAKGVRNLVENRFFADGPQKTRWVLSNSFTFSGLMWFVSPFVEIRSRRRIGTPCSALRHLPNAARPHEVRPASNGMRLSGNGAQ